MDKLVTYEYGQKFTTDDIHFQRNAVMKSMADFFNGFGSAYIIYGCELTYTLNGTYPINVGVTAGAVFINGEVLRVEAHSKTLSPQKNWYYTLKTTWDSAGSKMFEDGISRNTYEIRTAEIMESDSVPENSCDAKQMSLNNKIVMEDEISTFKTSTNDHIGNADIHVTKAFKDTTNDHTGNADIHVTKAFKDSCQKTLAIGSVMLGYTAPGNNWWVCQGQPLNPSQNPELYALLNSETIPNIANHTSTTPPLRYWIKVSNS